jgi:hypothetical protein
LVWHGELQMLDELEIALRCLCKRADKTSSFTIPLTGGVKKGKAIQDYT